MRLTFKVQSNRTATSTVGALCVDQVRTFELFKRAIPVLENGSQLCVAIGLAQGEECDISLDRDTCLCERLAQYVLGLGLRDKQQVVVFAADPFEVKTPNPLALAVKAEREAMLSKLHERRTQTPLFEEFKRSCLDSDCS